MGTSTSLAANAELNSGDEARAVRSSSLLVTTTSAGLARGLVVAKARRRKLHSSELDVTQLREAGMVTPLRSAPIDVNEFLPSDIHNLRRTVRTAAKEKGYNTFIRDGEVFIRKRKEDRPFVLRA